jgi:putative FmdB family regulatory protein
MPTYEYECGACEHRFEKYQSMNDKPVKKCPKCGKAKVRRIISGGAGVLFKGSGFYQTDYRSKGYKESAKKDVPKKDTSSAPACSGDCSSCDTKKK